MKLLHWRVTGFLVGALTLLASVPASHPERILALESERTLGNGELASFLHGSSERVVARAALALGRTKLRAAAPLLAADLRDSRTAVRAMSTYGLGLIADGTAAAQIVGSVRDVAGAVRVAALDAIERDEAAKSLSITQERAAAQAVAERLARDRDPIVRARAALTLAAFADGSAGGDAGTALTRAMRVERATEVRRHVMWSIFRRFATRVPRDVLATALNDADDVVRIEAVRAYGRLAPTTKGATADATAIAAVAPLLRDRSWRVAEQAGESLRLLRGETATAHLARVSASVHLPPIAYDALASIAPLPRPDPPYGKPRAPRVADAMTEPTIDPVSAHDMVAPANGSHPRVRIVTTKGNLYVTLYPEWAPLTVANFLNLADRGYYDHNRWFRIVPDFVVQTGDPHDDGNGDAGYSIPAEENPLEQGSYVISMGLNYNGAKPERDSAGTQYYITLSPQYHLDDSFTVFGAVTSGFDVLAHLVESDRVVRVERIPNATRRAAMGAQESGVSARR